MNNADFRLMLRELERIEMAVADFRQRLMRSYGYKDDPPESSTVMVFGKGGGGGGGSGSGGGASAAVFVEPKK